MTRYIAFAVDPNELFDKMREGPVLQEALSRRIIEALLGHIGFIDAVGMAAYGIIVISDSQERLRPVAELPKDRTPVLVVHKDGRRGVAICYYANRVDGSEGSLVILRAAWFDQDRRMLAGGDPAHDIYTTAGAGLDLDELAGWLPVPKELKL